MSRPRGRRCGRRRRLRHRRSQRAPNGVVRVRRRWPLWRRAHGLRGPGRRCHLPRGPGCRLRRRSSDRRRLRSRHTPDRCAWCRDRCRRRGERPRRGRRHRCDPRHLGRWAELEAGWEGLRRTDRGRRRVRGRRLGVPGHSRLPGRRRPDAARSGPDRPTVSWGGRLAVYDWSADSAWVAEDAGWERLALWKSGGFGGTPTGSLDGTSMPTVVGIAADGRFVMCRREAEEGLSLSAPRPRPGPPACPPSSTPEASNLRVRRDRRGREVDRVPR